MDKSWIKAHITSKPFKEGVKSFIEFARARSIRGIIACPCLKCCNVEHWEVDKCYGHILRYGFLPGYSNWSIHGENSVPSKPSRPTFGEDEIRSLVRDALGQIPLYSRGVGDSMFEDNVGESSQSSHRRVEDENTSSSSAPSMDEQDEIDENYEMTLLSEAEIIDRDGNFLRTQTMTTKEVIRSFASSCSLPPEGPPTPLTGSDILEQLSGASFIYDKSDDSSNKRNKRTRDGVGCSTNAHDEANAESSAFEDIESFVEEEMGQGHLL
ncbi:tetratricopeptide-like helical domain, DYW domain protein [Tanacetum coccineum]